MRTMLETEETIDVLDRMIEDFLDLIDASECGKNGAGETAVWLQEPAA